MQKANEAIDRFPDEAHFYGLRGDARYVEAQYDRAIENYDIAIRRRPDFFQYHLQRGLANEKLGNDSAARADMERSNQLFPTAAAHHSLGDIAARAGDRTQAIQHYQMVAGSGGPIGDQATAKLIRLDIADNPDKYLKAGCFADTNGNLAVALRNATPVTVGDIRFVVQYRDGNGVPRTREQSIRGPLASGERADRATGIGPWTEAAGCPVRIVSARVVD